MFMVWFSNFGYYADDAARHNDPHLALEAGIKHGFEFAVVRQPDFSLLGQGVVASWHPLNGTNWYVADRSN
jgi:hypothetical protein